jgi:uncharacterized repeat protein (TIGR03803 family)
MMRGLFNLAFEVSQDADIGGADGRLYGLTRSGGTSGFGSVFRISKSGGDFADIYSFSGYDPSGDSLLHPFALLEGSDQALYGMSHCTGMTSGPAGNHAAVFKLTKDGRGLKVLRTFVLLMNGVLFTARH